MPAESHNLQRITSAAPLYRQIAESLTEQIISGQLAPEARLPSERQLSEKLQVSRMTLRAALRELEGRGLIVRRRGDGTYVARPKIERQAARLVPFAESMRGHGYEISARIVIFEERMAEVSVASKLRLPVSAPVYYIQRLRLINREPVLLEQFSMPVMHFPDLAHFDLETRSVYEIWETEYGIPAALAQQSLEAVAATAYEAELLCLEPGAPLMLERRLAFDPAGHPFEYGEDLYRGDRFRFVTELAPLDLSLEASQQV